MLTITQYLMGRDKKYAQDYTAELEKNAKVLLDQVNALLKELGVENATVSSGWRPASLNATIPNASKTSAHITCQAVDIADVGQKISSQITDELLEKFGLWMENPTRTPTWCHLQIRPIRSGMRIFNP